MNAEESGSDSLTYGYLGLRANGTYLGRTCLSRVIEICDQKPGYRLLDMAQADFEYRPWADRAE